MKNFPSQRVLLALGLIWFGVAPVVRAQDAMKPGAPAIVTHFARADAIDVVKLLPPFPASGSIEEVADFEALRQTQAWRTPEQVAWAKLVAENDLFAVFGADNLLGSGFTKQNFPLLLALFKDVNDDLRPAVDLSKKLFARKRPYLIDPSIVPCIDKPANDAYPSGHGTAIYLRAAILAQVFPAQSDAILARAHRAAWGRVLAGVHYPTDLEAGRILAEACVGELNKSAAFHAAIEKCRAEAAAVAMKKAA